MNFVIVALIELRFGPHAQFCVFGLLAKFLEHSGHLFHSELDLDDPDLCYASS